MLTILNFIYLISSKYIKLMYIFKIMEYYNLETNI